MPGTRFLLARLHLESLVDKMNPAEIQVALESLPKGIEALTIAYDQAMQRVQAQRPGLRLLALEAMSWITYAKRHLSVVELRHALGVEHGTSDFKEDNLCDIDNIVSACGGLLIVDQGQNANTVRLVHYSTQEFLRKAGENYFPGAQEEIAVSCITYLLYDAFEGNWRCESGHIDREWVLGKRVLQYPLLLYAAQYWAKHASECSEQSVRGLMVKFLRDGYRVSNAAQVLNQSVADHAFQMDYEDFVLRNESSLLARRPISGIHLAAYFGIQSVVLMLLKNEFAADVRDTSRRSPLFWAAHGPYCICGSITFPQQRGRSEDRVRSHFLSIRGGS